MKPSTSHRTGASLLGLSLDGGRLEGVALRRTNGSIEIQKAFAFNLSLDPLAHDPQLVGREIRKHLDEVGIRERRCAVCLPLNWVLTLPVRLPELPEADLQSFLEVEAERGFPYPPDALITAQSRIRAGASSCFATLVAISRDHVIRLEAALTAAHLVPITFSAGIAALVNTRRDDASGVVALLPGRTGIAMLIAAGGGTAMVRSLEGARDSDAPASDLHADAFRRELRISLGQLPPEIRESIRRVRVYGDTELAEELFEVVQPCGSVWELEVERVRHYAPDAFPVALPAGTAVSPALSLGVHYLTGGRPDFEFLPPKMGAWEQFTARYASRKLGWAGVTAGVFALVVGLVFLIQQVQLWYWGSKWQAMSAQVRELDATQQQIRRFRPWFDESLRSLSVLRRLSEAFPEDGTVSAKSVEIRSPNTVICSGTARDRPALLRALDQLRSAAEVADVKVEQMRGRTPLEFTFNFRWIARGGS